MKTNENKKHYYIYGGEKFTLDFNGKQYELTISLDTTAEPPWEFDEGYLTTLYCWHRNYNLGHDHDFEYLRECYLDLAQNDTRLTARQKKYVEKKYYDLPYPEFDIFAFDYLNKNSNYVIKKLYLYDHGGLAISTNDFHDRWDSGCVGIAVLSKDTLLNAGVINENDKNWREKARENIDNEVGIYDTYLHGDVFGFCLYELKRCPTCGNIEKIDIDCMHDFWGDDIFENGILDYLYDNDIDGLGEAWQQYFEKLADGGEKL